LGGATKEGYNRLEAEMTEFKVNDVISYNIVGERFAVVAAVERGRLPFGEHYFTTDKLCTLVYRPDTGVMDKFAAYQDTAALLELANEQGKYLCIAGSQSFVDGNEARCYDRLSSGTLHPESALRLLERRRESGEVLGVGGRVLGKAVAIGNPTHPGSAFQQLCRNLSKATERRFQMGETVFIKPGVFPDGHWADGKSGTVSDLLEDGAYAYVAISGEEWTALVGVENVEFEPLVKWEPAPLSGGMIGMNAEGSMVFHDAAGDVTALDLRNDPAPSPNCASCGGALNERYERVEAVDGQRHHGMCADRIRSLAAERAPKVTADDPYARHQKREAMHLQACRDFEFNPSYRRGPAFSADTVPSGYREKFGAHPWSNDDDV
jgi:hypothetical protein